MSKFRGKCPLCDGTNLHRKRICEKILNLPKHFSMGVMYCADCTLCFLHPYLKKSELEKLYSGSYFVASEGGSENDDIPNPPVYKEFEAVREKKFRQSLDHLISYRPKATNILDIGAATGEFLNIAHQKGLKPFGIELSSYAAQKAKEEFDFEFSQTELGDYTGEEEFDLIHINHVFEHLTDPHGAVEKIKCLLSPGGLVYVEVPFQFNVLEIAKFLIMGKRKNFDVFSIHHPFFYRPKTLRRVFREHGLVCKEISVFKWSRYPANTVKEKLKRLIWYIAATFSQGVFIEAIFEKQISRR